MEKQKQRLIGAGILVIAGIMLVMTMPTYCPDGFETTYNEVIDGVRYDYCSPTTKETVQLFTTEVNNESKVLANQGPKLVESEGRFALINVISAILVLASAIWLWI